METLSYTTISSILNSKTLGSISGSLERFCFYSLACVLSYLAFFNVDQIICTLKVSRLLFSPLVSLHFLL